LRTNDKCEHACYHISSCEIIKSAEPYVLEDEESQWVVIPFLIKVSTDKFVINKKDHSELKLISANKLDDYKDLTDVEKLKELKFVK